MWLCDGDVDVFLEKSEIPRTLTDDTAEIENVGRLKPLGEGLRFLYVAQT